MIYDIYLDTFEGPLDLFLSYKKTIKNRLLEYQKYKELGELLSYKIIENLRVYYNSTGSPGK